MGDKGWPNLGCYFGGEPCDKVGQACKVQCSCQIVAYLIASANLAQERVYDNLCQLVAAIVQEPGLSRMG